MVMNIVLELLALPPCTTTQEGREIIRDAVQRNKYSQLFMDEIIDQALNDVLNSSDLD